MLIDAKPKLQKDIYDILQKSMYEAYMTSFIDDDDVDNDIRNRVKKEMTKSAKKYSEKFANEACGPLSQAIYEFVKSIGIITTPKSLTSPHGPVVGKIDVKEHTII